MNKIKIGFFSLTEFDGDEADYVAWHQMDHMPEQFRVPGLSWGQRFVATPACIEASAGRLGPMSTARHLQNYLMEADPRRVLTDFSALGRELQGRGRTRVGPIAHVQAAFQLFATFASPRVLLHPDAVAYRPNQGVYLLVEEVTDPERLDDWVREQHTHAIPPLLDVPGVAGMWLYAAPPDPRAGPGTDGTSAYGLPSSRLRITMIYLDDDPVAVAASVAPHLEGRWAGAPVEPRFAGPFRSYFAPPRSWTPLEEDHRG